MGLFLAQEAEVEKTLSFGWFHDSLASGGVPVGLSWHQSAGLGPLRLNFSSSGVDASVGVRGAGLSVGPRGTYVHFGAGGFRYSQRIDGPRIPLGPAQRFPTSAKRATLQPYRLSYRVHRHEQDRGLYGGCIAAGDSEQAEHPRIRGHVWHFGYCSYLLGSDLSGKPGRPSFRLLSNAVGAWSPLLSAPGVVARRSFAEGENSLRS